VNPAEAWLTDPMHPICCDTSALYFPSTLRRLRQRFPTRRVLLPAIAYFERQRQLRVRFGPVFHPEVLRQNLLEPLGIEILSCEEPVALLLAQMAEQIETRALSDLAGNHAWSDQQARQNMIRVRAQELRTRQANWTPVLQGEPGFPAPCGQRCRLGDYVVAATARSRDALLLTADRALLDAFELHPDLFPPALPPDVSV
jgi:predicted nucleic acid-binding protein